MLLQTFVMLCYAKVNDRKPYIYAFIDLKIKSILLGFHALIGSLTLPSWPI